MQSIAEAYGTPSMPSTKTLQFRVELAANLCQYSGIEEDLQ